MTPTRLACDALSTRSAALTFMCGVSSGWDYAAFSEWYVRHLITARRMSPDGRAGPIELREPGVAPVKLGEDIWSLPLRARLDTMAGFHLAMVSAHTRVLTALRRLVDSESIDFVNAALFIGTLKRTSGAAAWEVSLAPSVALSDCILALFAADYLARPDDYLRGLGVCRICDRIRFREGQLFRTLCASHTTTWLALNWLAPASRQPPPVSGVFRREAAADHGESPACSRIEARHAAP